jgi:Zn-dependent protease with chaperone function
MHRVFLLAAALFSSVVEAVPASALKSVQFAEPKLAIVIYHADAVPAPALLRAQTLAGAILRQAGIVVTWRVAGPSDLTPAPDEIPVHLLPSRPPNHSSDAGGYAVLAGDNSYAGISCPAVQASAAALESPEAIVLGAVMAHELGHILLRSRDHAANGVMVIRLGAREIQSAARGELQFLQSEARRMRIEAARRSAAAKNVVEDLHGAQARDSRSFNGWLSYRPK